MKSSHRIRQNILPTTGSTILKKRSICSVPTDCVDVDDEVRWIVPWSRRIGVGDRCTLTFAVLEFASVSTFVTLLFLRQTTTCIGEQFPF